MRRTSLTAAAATLAGAVAAMTPSTPSRPDSRPDADGYRVGWRRVPVC
ncbi:hypothetical protein [Methylobacterium sp. ID0610]